MTLLTDIQQQVLNFILARWENGEALPSCREIAARFGWSSPKAASDHLSSMKKRGYLSSSPASSRNYRLTEQALGLPVLGNIPAGFPAGGLGAHEEHFTLNPSSFGVRDRAAAFFLRVKGDSMIGRRIFDGDLVLVEKDTHPRHRSIVAALIDQEVTLKTFIQERGRAWLRSENPAYPDLTPLEELQIQGIARGVIRPLQP